MKLTYYALCYHVPEEAHPFIGDLPDLKTTTEGDSVEDLQAMLQDAALEILPDRLGADGAPPAQSSIDEVLTKADPELGQVAFVLPVTVFPKPRTRNVAVSVPEDALARIDAYCEAAGISRSALMVDGALALALRRRKSAASRNT
ncbi:MAG: type II toxin-antitoxin system HicB family antitoxin [Victivallales bacterium]|nr:type II toxin-antitoxin system HicB family antitoxin [Victivallales bacterium]